MTSDTTQARDVARATADVQAAIRAEAGEFVYGTRAEVVAFVNALPAGMRVRWEARPLALGGGYSVTFWRPSLFELALTPHASKATPAATEATTATREVNEHD